MYVNKSLANAYFIMGSRLYMKSGNNHRKSKKPSNIKDFRTLPTPFDNDLITSFEVTIILYLQVACRLSE